MIYLINYKPFKATGCIRLLFESETTNSRPFFVYKMMVI